MLEQLFAKHTKLLAKLQIKFRSNIIDQIPWNEKLIGIKGARGVGKTTMILQYINETFGFDRQCLYISLDDISIPFGNLIELAEEFHKRGGKHLFIDEIHKYPRWSQELKNIYDSLPDLQIVFTGSSILDISKGKADLSRRALIFDMQGLSFREYLQIETGKQFEAYTIEQIVKNHEQYSIEIFQQIKPYEHFDNYLRYGYYPYYLQGLDFYSVRLSNTISLILEVDLPYFLNIDFQYIRKLKSLLNILSNEIPYKPNISSLASALEVSWQSVIHYLNYLSDADIIRILHPEGKNVSVLAKPEKVLLHHPNHFYVFTDEIRNKGSLRESFFANQLGYKHKVETAKRGDFVIDSKYLFEVGGKNKTYHQIANIENSYIAADDIEFGYENKIPLWLFGFLY